MTNIMENSAPLISCICITNNSPLSLQRSLACFETQDYPNREIVISYPEKDLSTKNLVDQISLISDIVILRIESTEGESPDTTRNRAISAANGRFICIWEDKDWYNIGRLSCQYQAIASTKCKGSIFANIILFDFENKRAHSCNRQVWQESLFIEKKAINEQQFAGDKLLLCKIINQPHNYISIYQKKDYKDDSYFHVLIKKSIRIEEHIEKEISELTSLENYVL